MRDTGDVHERIQAQGVRCVDLNTPARLARSISRLSRWRALIATTALLCFGVFTALVALTLRSPALAAGTGSMSVAPSSQSAVLGTNFSGSPWVGVLTGILAGLLFALIHAVSTIRYRAGWRS